MTALPVDKLGLDIDTRFRVMSTCCVESVSVSLRHTYIFGSEAKNVATYKKWLHFMVRLFGYTLLRGYISGSV